MDQLTFTSNPARSPFFKGGGASPRYTWLKRITFTFLCGLHCLSIARAEETPRPFLDWVARELALDAASVAALHRLADGGDTAVTADRLELAQGRIALRHLLEADEVDETAVMAELDRIGAHRIAIAKARVRALIRMRASLTPDQRTALTRLRRQTFIRVATACRDDARRLCAEVAGRRQRGRCLFANRASVSAPCRAEIEKLPFASEDLSD